MRVMKEIFTKKIAAILSLVSVLGMFSVGVADAAPADLANEVGEVCDYIDNDSKNAIKLIGENLYQSTKSIDVDALLTDKVLEKFESKNAAKKAVTDMLSKSLYPYFSIGSDVIEGNISKACDGIDDYMNTFFGGKAESEKWLELFLLTRKDVQNLKDNTYRWTWATGSGKNSTPIESLEYVFESMDKLQVRTMDARLEDDRYAAFKDGFADLNWTSEMVVDACRKISDTYDSGRLAEFELMKAAARYSTKLYIDGAEKNLAYAGKDLEDNANVYIVSPSGLPKDVDMYITVMGYDEVNNLVGYSSSDKEVAEVVPDEAKNAFKINVKKEGTTDIVIKRDPLQKNDNGDNKDWLVRFRLIVGNKIGDVNKPAWNTTGTLSWAAAENAKRYKVTLYKDGAEIGTYETANTNYDFSKIALDTGSYTATVQAFGDTDAEYGNVSDVSDKYDVKAAIEKANKPVWDTATEKKLVKWDSVENATGYIVRIYNGTVLVHESAVVSGNEYDATSAVSAYGTYRATVQAVGAGDTKGAESDKSNAYIVGSTVTGNVKLEKFSGVRSDNNGIKVSIRELPNIASVTTDNDGNYTIKNVPDGTYTLYFERVAYLSKKVTVNVSGGNVTADSAVMIYGDLDGMNGINVQDVTRIRSILGSRDYKDLQSDSTAAVITSDDFALACRNLGKVVDDQD